MIDEIVLKVEARTKEALKKLEEVKKATEEAINGPLRDELKGLEEKKKLLDENLKKEKERTSLYEVNDKLIRLQIAADKQKLTFTDKLLKLNEKIVEQTKNLDKSKDIVAADREQKKRIKQEEVLLDYAKRRKAEQEDYAQFVKRSSMESGRYADKLDKRDRTRSLRENLRRGMEKGTAISERFHSEEIAVYKLERSLGIASTAFDKVRHPAEQLTDAFYSFQKISYAAQSALGVLAGTIGDMVGGMMALVGVAGQAAGSLIAVAGAMANLGAGMMTAKFALSGVGAAVQQLWSGQNQYNRALRDAKKAFRDLRFEAEDAALSEQEAAIALEKAREALARVQDLPADSRARREAELEFQRAELNYRRAKARVKDTNDALKKGPNAGVDRSQDPLNNLTKSQVAFAKYLVTLKPVIQGLKEAAASSFLPPLQKSIDVVVKNVLPTLKDGLNDIGGALGDASRNFTDAFKDKENIDLFRDFLENSKPTLRILGAVAANAFGGILAILKAAQPITDRFARWIFTVSERFDKLGKGAGQDNLKKFFKLSGDVASDLGTAFKLVFGGFKNIVEATFPNGPNSGAGGIILQWLKELGAGFKLFTGSSDFANFLKASTDNAKTALSTLGDFLKIFLDLAARPETKEFWMTIEAAVPYVRKILDDGLKAGPAFGKLIVAIAQFISLLSEGAAIQNFFGTLELIVNTLAAFVRAIKPVLDFLGAIHGVFLALVTAGIFFRRGIQIMMGIMMKLLRVTGFAVTAFSNFRAKIVAAQKDGQPLIKRINGIIQTMRELKREATNLKRIELLQDIAKGDKQRQIAALRDKMGQLNLRTKAGQAEAKKLKAEIDSLNMSYKRLRGELQANAATAKTWGQTVANSAAAATFGLDRYAKRQAAFATAGKLGMIGGATALGIGSTISAVQTGGGGVGAGISALGAGLTGASMFAGPAAPFLMAGGIGASIVGSIVAGFDQANQERKAAEDQKKIEIKAKLVELQADKLNEKRTALGALVGKGQDVTGANKTLSKITDAAKISLNTIKNVQPVNSDQLVSSLLTSNVLADVAISSSTRNAIIKAATAGAASGIYTITDEAGQNSINYDALQSALEAAFTGEDGQGKGVAGLKAFQTRVGKTRLDSSGNVVTVAKQTQDEEIKRLQTAAKAAQMEAVTLYAGLSMASQGNLAIGSDTTESYAKLLGLSVKEVINTGYKDLQALTTAKSNKLKAIIEAPAAVIQAANKVKAPTTTLEKSQDKQFREAMAGIGKPKKLPDPLPTPTTSYYKNSMTQAGIQVGLLRDIKTSLTTTTKQTIELKDAKGKVISTYEVSSGVID